MSGNKESKISFLLFPFAVIGAFTVFNKSYRIAQNFYPLFMPRRNLLKKYGPNSWVVITGASDGLGKQFAFEFSKQGFNCILIARNENKIQNVINTLKNDFPNISYKIILANFQNVLHESFFANIEEEILKNDVRILINNVGITSVNNFFNETDEAIKQQILINSYSAVILSKIFINKIRSNTESPKRYGIINVGSILGKFALPYLSIYCGTKAFLNNFSESLFYEFHEKNIDIFCLTPYYVSTKMTGYKKLSFDTITPEQCVNSAIKQFSYGKKESSGNWKHELITLFFESFWLRSYLIRLKKAYYQNLVQRSDKIKDLRKKKTLNKN